MKPKPFDGLKTAIRAVLSNSTPGGTGNVIGGSETRIVEESDLKNLQAEYNICFVEPEDEQLEILK